MAVQLYWLIDKYFFNVAKIWVSNYSKAVAIFKVSVPFLFWVSIFMVLQVVLDFSLTTKFAGPLWQKILFKKLCGRKPL